MKIKKMATLLFSVILLLSSVPAFAADRTMTLTEDLRLTSDLNLNVESGDVLTIDGENKYYIYEMGGVLKNSGAGFVKLQNTILYPSGTGAADGSIAEFVAIANAVTITAASGATSVTFSNLSALTNGAVEIIESSNTSVISTSGTITPRSSTTNVTLTIRVTGNGTLMERQISVSVLGVGGGYVPPSDDGSGSGSSGSSSSSGGSSSVSKPDNTVTVEIDGGASITATIKDEIVKATVPAASVNASVAKLLKELETVPEKEQIITIALNNLPDSVNKVEVSLPNASVVNIVEQTNAALSVDAGKLGTITFDNNALAAIVDAGKGDLRIVAEDITSQVNNKLTNAQKAAVGENPVYDFGVFVGNTRVSDFGGGAVTINLPYTPKTYENPNSIIIYYIDANGKLQMITNSKYDPKTGEISFTVHHFSLYMIAYNYKTFNDISGHWAKNSIEFAASRGLVAGVGNNMYDPYRDITRGEFAQMVWNVLQPPVGNVSVYADVKIGAWYYKPVMSLKSAGLLDGLLLDGNNFEPAKPITREEMAVIMANAAKYNGKKLPTGIGDLDKNYVDATNITSEYREYVWQAIFCNLMIGSNAQGGKMQFIPKATATRGEAAQIQVNILDILK